MRENNKGQHESCGVALRRPVVWSIAPAVLFAGMVSAGCGSDSGSGTKDAAIDTMLPTPDTALPTPDTALPTPDTALPTPDTALPTVDTGLPTIDTGLPTPDTALPAVDTGLPAVDTGIPMVDTGTASIDTGVPFACRNDMVVAPTDITVDTTWPCNTYVMNGIVAIGNGATLTIAAGSTIYGNSQDNTNPAVVVAKRDGRLVAIGTREHPIVFTSSMPVGSRVPGDSLAGIALLGRATINNGTCQNDPNPATPECEAPGFLESNIEGLVADDPRGQYGGNDDTHDCGQLKYVRVEFSGSLIGPDNEMNGITVGACGSKTTFSYVQVHRGFDDGIEFFGGAAKLDHIVLTGNTDDSLDWDNGFRGKVQFLIVEQGYSKGDKGFEGDNLGGAEMAVPHSNPEIWNATLIAEPGSTHIGMHLREGTYYKIRNMIALNWGGGVLDSDAVTVVPANDWPTLISVENSVFFGGAVGAADTVDNDQGFDETAALTDPARMNTTTVDPQITSITLPTPNYVPLNTAAVSGKATPPAGFDQTATYAGAVAPGDPDPWYTGWTAFPAN